MPSLEANLSSRPGKLSLLFLRAIRYLLKDRSFSSRVALARYLAKRFLPRGPEPYPLAGTRSAILLDPSDRFQSLMWFGIYQREIVYLLARILHPGDVVLDVGAHVGYFSLLAAECVGASGQVHCFEPDPRVYYQLRRSALLSAGSNVIVNQLAVSHRTGDLQLHLAATLGWSTTAVPDDVAVEGHVKVSAISLDAYAQQKQLSRERLRLVKIDAEGAEAEVLAGMQRLLAGARRLLVICEYRPHRQQLVDLLRHTIPHGYRAFRIRRLNEHGPRRRMLLFFRPTVWLQPIGPTQEKTDGGDILFLRSEPSDLGLPTMRQPD